MAAAEGPEGRADLQSWGRLDPLATGGQSQSGTGLLLVSLFHIFFCVLKNKQSPEERAKMDLAVADFVPGWCSGPPVYSAYVLRCLCLSAGLH